MTCSACSTIVEAALRTVPGVTNAVVSLLQQVARVEYDPAVATEVPPTLAQKFSCFLVALSCCRQPNSAKQHLFVSFQSQLLEAVTETGYTAGLLGREDISSITLQVSNRQMIIAVPAWHS